MIARSLKKQKSRTSMPHEEYCEMDYSKAPKKKGGKKHTGMDKKKH